MNDTTNPKWKVFKVMDIKVGEIIYLQEIHTFKQIQQSLFSKLKAEPG